MKNKKIKLLLASLSTASVGFGSIYAISQTSNYPTSTTDALLNANLQNNEVTKNVVKTNSSYNYPSLNFDQFLSNSKSVSGALYYETLEIADSNECYVRIVGNNSAAAADPVFKDTVKIGEKEYKLTTIGDSAFAGNTKITGSVTFSETIKTIGGGAFQSCTGITSVNFSSSITNIGAYSFNGCTALVGSLKLGEQTEVIGESAFVGCRFTEVNFPANIKRVEAKAFYNCSTITNKDVNLSSVEYIGDYAFYSCTGLNQTLSINQNVKSIGTSAFEGCTNLKGSLAFVKTKYIGESAFANCKQIQGVSFAGNTEITEIPYRIFYSCTALTGNIELPDSITKIGANAFASTKITGVKLPSGLTTLGASIFSSCTSLKYITCDKNPTDGIYLPQELEEVPATAFNGCTGLTGKIYIPTSVTHIRQSAFKGCTGLAASGTILYSEEAEGYNVWCIGLTAGAITGAITIQNQNTYGIAGAAFQNSTAATTFSFLTTPKLQVIDDYAFSGCTVLTQAGSTGIRFPDKLVYLGSYAFQSCTTLSGIIYVPYSVTAVGTLPFYGCTALRSTDHCTSEGVLYSEGADWQQSSYAEWCLGKINDQTKSTVREQFNIKSATVGIAGGAFRGFTSSQIIGILVLPECIKYIGDYAFQSCTGLQGVNFLGTDPAATTKSQLTHIGKYAFASCTNMTTTAEMPASLQYIGDYAFYNDSAMEGGIVIPSSTKYLGTAAFRNCSSITSLGFQTHSLEEISDYAFAGCSKISGGMLLLPSNITRVGNYAFDGCAGFSGWLSIPTTVKTIGNYAFRNCSGIEQLGSRRGTESLPAILEEIGTGAFMGCTNVKGDITIPDNIEYIPSDAFNGCGGCTTSASGTHTQAHLTIPEKVKYIGSNAFANTEFCKIEFKGETAPKMGWNWQPDLTNDGRVVIPAGARDKYLESNINIPIANVGPKAVQTMSLNATNMYQQDHRYKVGKKYTLKGSIDVVTDGGESRACKWRLWAAEADKEFDTNLAPWLKIDENTGKVYWEAATQEESGSKIGTYSFRIKATLNEKTAEGAELTATTEVIKIEIVEKLNGDSDPWFWTVLSISIIVPSIMVAVLIFWLCYKIRIHKQKELRAKQRAKK